MLRRRIFYGLALGCALLFQICFTGYLATFLLVLTLVFPVFSLLLSLPGMLRCRLSLSPARPGVTRGGTCRWTVTLENSSRLPLARLSYRQEERNLLTGGHAAVSRALSGASRGWRGGEEADTAHCGVLVCTLSRTRVCDLLGLFTLPLAPPPPARLPVLPAPADPEALPALPRGGRESAGLRPRPGGGPGEDYDLRAYRPGDPMRTVHWKLSSKWDELVVRETLEERRVALVLTFDLFGTPEALDRTFDRLNALSRLLLHRERPHCIQWADPVSGVPHSRLVDGECALLSCLDEVFSTPAPPAGRSILDAPLRVAGYEGPVHHVHLTAGEGGADA